MCQRMQRSCLWRGNLVFWLVCPRFQSLQGYPKSSTGWKACCLTGWYSRFRRWFWPTPSTACQLAGRGASSLMILFQFRNIFQLSTAYTYSHHFPVQSRVFLGQDPDICRSWTCPPQPTTFMRCGDSSTEISGFGDGFCFDPVPPLALHLLPARCIVGLRHNALQSAISHSFTASMRFWQKVRHAFHDTSIYFMCHVYAIEVVYDLEVTKPLNFQGSCRTVQL